MDKNYRGVIIEESLQDKSILKEVKILKTKVEKVTTKHKTPWLKKWTLHTIEIQHEKADTIAEKLSKAISKDYWYADFKNSSVHYIIFSGKIFKVDRTKKEQYIKAKNYGISLGIPEHQVDFSPEIK